MATSGIALNAFNDFVAATESTYVDGPKGLRNEAGKNVYWYGRFLKGEHAMKKTLRGGSSIKSSMVFRDNGTFEWYQPGSNRNWKNPQRLQSVEANWRFCTVHMSWVEQEIILNDIVNHGTEDAQYHQFVEIRNEKEMIMWTSKWNGLEESLWAPAHKTTMEGEGADFKNPYSIWAFVNEFPNGLFNDLGGTGAWTVVEGIDPTATDVDGQFTPQQQTYNSSEVNNSNNIISKFDDLFHDVEFQEPPTLAEYWTDPNYESQIIVTSSRGRAIVKQLYRASQDHFVLGPQDPGYNNPRVYGIPVTRAPEIDTAAVFPKNDASALTTEFGDDSSNPTNGPRFQLLNTKFLYPVFHTDMYFHKREVTKHHNVPDTWVCPVATYANLFCNSRKRQGSLAPEAGIEVYTS